VRRVGGLADTVVDATPENVAAGKATGFAFDVASVTALDGALQRAGEVYAQQRTTWNGVMSRAMAQDFSWSGAATQYMALYRELVPDAPASAPAAAARKGVAA
jgi:starch synthase